MTDGVFIGFSLVMGILSMISFTVSLICIAIIVGFKNSTHQVQYVPLKDSMEGYDYQEEEDTSYYESPEDTQRTPEEEYRAEQLLKQKMNRWKEFTGTKQEEYETYEEKA